MDLQINGSRPEICFAVIGGQVSGSNENLQLTTAFYMQARIQGPNLDSLLPPIETNEAGKFYEVLPYTILPGTVKGVYPNIEICLKAGEKDDHHWSCFPVNRNISFKIQEMAQ